MKLDNLIELLQHVRTHLPGDTPVCFTSGIMAEKQVFDLGEKDRDNYCCCVSPYEVWAHTDPFGRYHIPIREIIEPEPLRTPCKIPRTEEEKKAKSELFDKLKEWVHKQFTVGHAEFK